MSKLGLRLACLTLPLALLGCVGGSSDWHGDAGDICNTVLVADLNGDGRSDATSTNVSAAYPPGQGYVSVRLQTTGTGNPFMAPIQSSAGLAPWDVVAADLNGDDRPDLLTLNQNWDAPATFDRTLSILIQSSTQPGSFQAPVPVLLGSRNPWGMAVGDINGDGRPDLVVAADGGNSLLLFLQGPSGTYGTPQEIAIGGVPTAVALADLDGDGLLDIAATTTGNTVAVLLQDIDHVGTFLAPQSLAVGSCPVALKLVDLDGNGRMDILTANQGTPSVPTRQGLSVLLQTAPWTFQAATSYDTGNYVALSLAVGDLNEDGRLDVAVAHWGLSGTPGGVAILTQDAEGTLSRTSFLPGYVGPSSVALGDLNGDGHLDLLVADGYPWVYFQDSATPGTFLSPVRLIQ